MPRQPLVPTLVLAILIACAPHTTVPIASVDCGSRPSLEQARLLAQTLADRTLWGAGTDIQGVTVGEKTRWHAALTSQWPRGESRVDVIEGWSITFTAKPKTRLNPYASPQTYEVLLDKDKVLHWRTQTEWDRGHAALPRVDRTQPPPQAPSGSAVPWGRRS